MSIKDRLEKYTECSRHYLMPKVPVVFTLTANNSSKLSLDEPFDTDFSDAMLCTMIKLCLTIEGAIFSYNSFDQLTIISRNDQKDHTQPWYDNEIQKLASVSSSIATLEFNKIYGKEMYFTSHVFTLPTMAEAATYISSLQHKYTQKMLNTLVLNELKIPLDESITLSIEEKISLLEDEEIYYDSLSPIYKKGASAYKIQDHEKMKWDINRDIPVFLNNKDFLYSIFLNS